MDEKNPHAVALAGKRALGMARKINELGITSKMTQEQINTMAIERAKEIAGENFKSKLNGQEWYISSLVKFSALTAREKMDIEYQRAFPETASEDEIIAALEQLEQETMEALENGEKLTAA